MAKQSTKPTAELADAPSEWAPELLNRDTVAWYLGISRAQVTRMDAAGLLPKPIRMCDRLVLWRRRELADWCDAGCPSRSLWEKQKWRPSLTMKMSAFLKMTTDEVVRQQALIDEMKAILKIGDGLIKVAAPQATHEPWHKLG